MLNVLKKSTILLKMIKELLKKTINKLGFDLKSYDPGNKQINFDYLLKDKISKNPIIFDVVELRSTSYVYVYSSSESLSRV